MRKKVASATVTPCDVLSADVLILGGGLAGLRAALAATAAQPGCRVAVVTAGDGPAGSSFANPNNAWGMQVCTSEAEVRAMVREILELAAPGRVEPRLAELVAAESLARFSDLRDLGVRFEAEPGEGGAGAPGCFSPQSRRAVIVKDLAHVYGCFRRHLDGCNVRWLPGWLVGSLLTESGRVRGVLLVSRDGDRPLAVGAESTVMALGGPAPLFARHLAGPGNPGYALGLLRRAGARLVNAGFLQFFWTELPGHAFFPVEQAFTGDWALSGRDDDPLAGRSPAAVAALAASRAGHCPCAHGRPDAVLDTALAGLAGQGGVVRLGRGEAARRVALFAHAGNGGAAIDPLGHTGVPGLFAAGECAGGMHGANRMGGAMVTATQVFGARAGWSAALEASLRDPLAVAPLRDLAEAAFAALPVAPRTRADGLARLGRELAVLAPFGRETALAELSRRLLRQMERPTDWILDLCRETALAMVADQLATLARDAASEAA